MGLLKLFVKNISDKDIFKGILKALCCSFTQPLLNQKQRSASAGCGPTELEKAARVTRERRQVTPFPLRQRSHAPEHVAPSSDPWLNSELQAGDLNRTRGSYLHVRLKQDNYYQNETFLILGEPNCKNICPEWDVCVIRF